MKAPFGLSTLTSGRLLDADNWQLSHQQQAALGIVFVRQNRTVFPSLTVAVNLEMGALLRRHGVAWAKQNVFALFFGTVRQASPAA